MTQRATERAQARAEAQRERILEAALQCFAQHGFHAANMAGIADAAQMSPGLIYRYFASKSEIILAIIEHQLELSRSEIGKLHDSANLPLDLWRSLFQPEQKVEHIDAGLYAEMSAEAARDPAIGTAVAESDRTLREAFSGWLARGTDGGGPGLPAGQARAVGLLIQCLMDGLRLRRLREPELDAVLCKRALRDLLTPWLEGVEDPRGTPGNTPREKTGR